MNKAKGDAYENHICCLIRSELNKPCYLWSHTPDEILIKAGIIHSNNQHRLYRKDRALNGSCLMDTGVDLISFFL
jgi:hypothetical protein